jgi:hypothetical protein
MPRRKRLQSSYFEDCIAVLERPALDPKVRRFGGAVVQIEDAKRAKIAAEVREIFDLMEPVIRALGDGT